jgi:hypothetical protein
MAIQAQGARAAGARSPYTRCWASQSASTPTASAGGATRSTRHGQPPWQRTLTAGAARICRRRTWARAAVRAVQARRNTKVPLVPPKPKLFFTATSMRMARAVLAQ